MPSKSSVKLMKKEEKGSLPGLESQMLAIGVTAGSEKALKDIPCRSESSMRIHDLKVQNGIGKPLNPLSSRQPNANHPIDLRVEKVMREFLDKNGNEIEQIVGALDVSDPEATKLAKNIARGRNRLHRIDRWEETERLSENEDDLDGPEVLMLGRREEEKCKVLAMQDNLVRKEMVKMGLLICVYPSILTKEF